MRPYTAGHTFDVHVSLRACVLRAGVVAVLFECMLMTRETEAEARSRSDSMSKHSKSISVNALWWWR